MTPHASAVAWFFGPRSTTSPDSPTTDIQSFDADADVATDMDEGGDSNDEDGEKHWRSLDLNEEERAALETTFRRADAVPSERPRIHVPSGLFEVKDRFPTFMQAFGGMQEFFLRTYRVEIPFELLWAALFSLVRIRDCGAGFRIDRIIHWRFTTLITDTFDVEKEIWLPMLWRFRQAAQMPGTTPVRRLVEWIPRTLIHSPSSPAVPDAFTTDLLAEVEVMYRSKVPSLGTRLIPSKPTDSMLSLGAEIAATIDGSLPKQYLGLHAYQIERWMKDAFDLWKDCGGKPWLFRDSVHRSLMHSPLYYDPGKMVLFINTVQKHYQDFKRSIDDAYPPGGFEAVGAGAPS